MRNESLEFLKALVNAPSPSGHEERAAEVYRQYVGQFADVMQTDVQGNVLAAVNAVAKTRIMLAGHMDEIGYIVHYITDEGLLRFTPIGDTNLLVSVGQRVVIHASEPVGGVIGWKPVHLMTEEEQRKIPDSDELWIDIGVTTREEAMRLVQVGDVVTYEYGFRRLHGDRAVGRGFDNKAGCFVVAEALRLLKEEGGLHPEIGVYAVATVQEEIGFRGAQTSAYGVDAVSGIAVDVTHAIDYPAISKDKWGDVAVGNGPALARGSTINTTVFRLLMDCAQREKIPVQVEVSAECSGTDASAMQITKTGMATGLVSIPLRYMHTPCELLSLEDVQACARLLAAYCRAVTPQTDFVPRL